MTTVPLPFLHVQARKEIHTMADKGKAFMKTMTEAMSRNLYR